MNIQTIIKSKFRNLIILGIIIILLAGIYVWDENRTTDFDEAKIKTSSFIDYPPEYNYAQYGTTCGPFSTAGVVRAIAKKEVDSLEFSKNIKWKIFDLGTAPKGLKKQLRENGVSVEVPKLRGYADEERIKFLQERLSQGHAIIILGEIESINYQHYLTVLGFNSSTDEFYLYDSFHYRGEGNLTIDSNGDLPGNRNVNSEELLDFWRGGGMYGLYEWYAIIGSRK